MEIIEKTSKINEEFKNHIELDLKNSIFEFFITGIIIVDKGKQFDDYKKNKSECENCQTKFL